MEKKYGSRELRAASQHWDFLPLPVGIVSSMKVYKCKIPDKRVKLWGECVTTLLNHSSQFHSKVSPQRVTMETASVWKFMSECHKNLVLNLPSLQTLYSWRSQGNWSLPVQTSLLLLLQIEGRLIRGMKENTLEWNRTHVYCAICYPLKLYEFVTFLFFECPLGAFK